jgi:myo-inositol-1(or 4)-monophosphatase
MKRDQYLQTAIDLAERSGRIMRKNFGLAMKKEWKDHRSPVTETDLAINELVLKTIKSRYPSHSILSEEGSDLSGGDEYLWICDPVDGTHNFSHGIPTATFALGLMRKRIPILSVVYDPFLKRLFYAQKGKGAYLNGHRIHVNKNTSLKSTVIGAGKLKAVRNIFPLIEEGRDHGATFITGLSIHYMCALVAVGEFSAAFFGGESPHDITPSKLLVEEAGGRATDLFGKTPTRFDVQMKGQLCSNGGIHGQLLKILEKTS